MEIVARPRTCPAHVPLAKHPMGIWPSQVPSPRSQPCQSSSECSLSASALACRGREWSLGPPPTRRGDPRGRANFAGAATPSAPPAPPLGPPAARGAPCRSRCARAGRRQRGAAPLKRRRRREVGVAPPALQQARALNSCVESLGHAHGISPVARTQSLGCHRLCFRWVDGHALVLCAATKLAHMIRFASAIAQAGASGRISYGRWRNRSEPPEHGRLQLRPVAAICDGCAASDDGKRQVSGLHGRPPASSRLSAVAGGHAPSQGRKAGSCWARGRGAGNAWRAARGRS